MASVFFNPYREGKNERDDGTYRANCRGEPRPMTSRRSRGKRLGMPTPRALVVDENCIPSCSS
jgi:hypothetical protein